MKRNEEHIYARYETLSPVYQGGRLTNHLPMMLTALEECGVPENRIEEILDQYRDEKGLFSLSAPSTPVDEFDQEWINQTGFFLGEINKLGSDVVVGMALNKLTKALQSGLYHGLIRLAYAVRSKNDVLIAQALAYFELIKYELDLSGNSVTIKELPKAFENLCSIRDNAAIDMPSSGTFDKMEQLLQQEDVTSNLVIPMQPDFHQKDMLQVFLNHYKKTQDFYTLHVITGFHALVMLEEFFTDFEEVLQRFYLTAQITMLLHTEPRELLQKSHDDFETLIHQIDTLQDAHDIKFLFSLYELDKLFGNPDCLVLAQSIL